MRHFIILILILGSCTQLFCQQTKHVSTKAPWDDTSYIVVKLIDTIKSSKIVWLNIGKKATISLNLYDILKEVKKSKPENLKRINKFLDSASLMSDTILVDDLSDFNYIVSDLLQKGKARVFYKKENIFVTAISHRLEKYGKYAHRFFYLPDSRPFFSTMEYSGILEKGKYFSDPGELGELYKKLSSERKE